MCNLRICNKQFEFEFEHIMFKQNALSPKNGKGSACAENARVCWIVCKMKLSMTLYNVTIL
jgi:hypothetical protein